MRILLILLFSLCTLCQAADFTIQQGQRVTVSLPEGLSPVAATALDVLSADMQRVLSVHVEPVSSKRRAHIVCRVDAALPRESYRLSVKGRQLFVTGGDAHGLAYGLMELSRRLGVSPWEDWADAVPQTLARFSLPDSFALSEQPAVAYRGIFINDEDWGLLPWATQQEPGAWTIRHGRIAGAVGPRVTERIFRLMLRLRLNYYWPPMHECTQPFFLTAGNREVARRYGIYVGGSHCEPMASSAAAEWGLRGEGEYNYVTNSDAVRRFWQERLDSVKGQEIVYTLGMRGVHDGAMQGVTTRDEKVRALQQVIDDQRAMLTATTGRALSDVPQVFVPYKEVLDIYHDGLRVPDDVTLMWTDDNYGYIRYFPDSLEAARPGGNGLYYHVSYWGRPHDYCWLSTLSPYLMEQQLTEAYHRGIRQMWMLNVGDIKPAEVDIHVYSDLAWHGVARDLRQGQRTGHIMAEMMAGIFGQDTALVSGICESLDASYRLAWERKPEHMAGTRVEESDKAYWNVVRPVEYWTAADVAHRLEQYTALSDRVEQLASRVDMRLRDAYYELVRYPVQAAAQQNVKYLSAERSQTAHDSIQSLTRVYNIGMDNGGKWQGILSAAPRGLRVFRPVSADEVPQYGPCVQGGSAFDRWLRLELLDRAEHKAALLQQLGPQGEMLDVRRGERYYFEVPRMGVHADEDMGAPDSLTLEVRLLPSHPVVGERQLAFSIDVEGGTPVLVRYETYGRSEAWKRNVLRNLAVLRVTVPIGRDDEPYIVTFQAMTDGVVLESIWAKSL